MYTWLSDALGDSGTVITANRRLARILVDQYSAGQLAIGRNAWRSPSIYTWSEWIVSLTNTAPHPDDLPTRINSQQGQVLWEQCLQKESYDGPGLAALVRLCRETRQRLADWQVSIRDVARAAQSEDHRIFASVLGRYLSLLERNNWVDEAGLGAQLLQLLADRRIEIAGRHTFVGFERLTPLMTEVHQSIVTAGATLSIAPVPTSGRACSLRSFDNSGAEFRAAGAWARRRIQTDANARIAIIANNLDQNADVIARQVREGATPGWQHGHPSLYDVVNVSYGQRLADYPAIAIALLLLRWLVDELSSTDVGLLLRSPLLGGEDCAGRSRLELRLRRLPDRRWTPSMVTAELRGRDDSESVSDWLAKLAAFSKRRRDLPKYAAPASWAVFLDQVLSAFLWPGVSALNSDDFQLINRWRELLNEFARLGLVNSTMSPRAAVARLETMSADVIFQPESTHASVHLLGPLEAAGLRFDGTWITGVTTASWPPTSTPLVLVSRRLQEERGMPDSVPADTLQFAKHILDGLVASSEDVVCSYALSEDDAEQTPSDLLMASQKIVETQADPTELYATRLLNNADVVPAQDHVPPVTAGEKISGGAGTVQRQISDPVSAFICGRLGATIVSPQAVGIPAAMRGKLIHDALYNLYRDLPASDRIRSWQGRELASCIEDAVNFAFAKHERNTDIVLQQILLLERSRISDLLREFVALDGDRGDFQVAAVEGKLEFVSGHIRLPLRFDRIDSLGDGDIAILDYKTGSAKRLLNKTGDVQEIQLFVYAVAAEAEVSALALVNVDSREIVFDGVGRGYTKSDDWPSLLHRVSDQIAAACHDMASGDVRINIEQGVLAARPLNLLTRYTELRHDDD
jgi:probable DNA repair protein